MSLSFSIHDHHTLIRQDTILSRVTKSSRDEWDQSRIIAVVSHFITSLKNQIKISPITQTVSKLFLSSGPSDANKGSHASSHIKTTTSHNKVVYFFQVQVTNRYFNSIITVPLKSGTVCSHLSLILCI